MKTIKVEIVRETRKAKLVKSGNNEIWVQNRSFKDGYVNLDLLNKKVLEQKKWAKDQKKYQDEQNRVISLEDLELYKSTEKAYNFLADVEFDKKRTRVSIWIPKSWTLNVRTLEKKFSEAVERFGNQEYISLVSNKFALWG